MSFDIKKTAHLARLQINQQEIDALKPKLDRILEMISELQQVDTTNVAPLSSPLAEQQRLRDDKATEQDHHKAYQKIASLVMAGLYIVPKVIEGSE